MSVAEIAVLASAVLGVVALVLEHLKRGDLEARVAQLETRCMLLEDWRDRLGRAQ